MPLTFDDIPIAGSGKRGGLTFDDIPALSPSKQRAKREAEREAAKVPGLVRSINQGATFGWNDEAVAGLTGLAVKGQNLFRRATGKPIPYTSEEAQEAVLQAEREAHNKFSREHPLADIGLQIIGGAATGGAGGKYIGNAKTALSAAGRGAAVGAGYGAAAGAGYDTGDLAERADGAASGAAFGAVTGGVLSGAGKALANRKAARITRGPTPEQIERADVVNKFDRVKVDPVPAIVGPEPVQQVGQTLAGNPILGAPLRSAAKRTATQAQAARERIAGSYGAATGRFEAGQTLKTGVADAADRLKGQGSKLYAAVEPLERSPARIPAANASQALDDAFAAFTTPEARSWFERKAGDLVGLRNMLGEADGTLTFAELKRVRGVVGAMMKDPELINTGQAATLNKVYGALSDDMANGAATIGGPEAARALSRADSYWSAVRTRVDDNLSRFSKADTESGAYDHLINIAKTKGAKASWPQLGQLKRSLNGDEWDEIASGVVRTMGGDGDQFSPAKFATEWKAMNPEARRLMFGGQGRGARYEDMEALATVGAKMAEASRFYNHSQSGNVAQTVGTLAAAGGAVPFLGIPKVIAVLGGGYGTSKVLSSPGVGRWLAQTPMNASPRAANAHLARLRTLAQRNPALISFYEAVRKESGLQEPAVEVYVEGGSPDAYGASYGPYD